MTKNKNTPVVIGVSSINQKTQLDEALVLMDLATKQAIDDCGNVNISSYINDIQIPKGYWKYRDPGKWLSKKNGILDAKTSIAKVGVLQQSLIDSACKKIIDGEVGASLILGAESRYKMIQALKNNESYKETKLTTNPDNYIKAQDELRIPEEEKFLGKMAVGYYSIIESAYRFNKKNSIESHNDKIAEIYSEFSQIATNNKDGWIDRPFSKKEIMNCSPSNKLQAYPYNKLHCTSWNVNQASALIICSLEVADKLKINERKRVYPLASSQTNHMIPTIQRKNLIKSDGMQLAADFISNYCNRNDIKPNLFDMYSCFPIAVELFADTLNKKFDASLTITGGMPYAGGPLNHFVLTSTVKMIEKIREDISGIGLVTGVSGLMTKQSYALWAKECISKYEFKDVTSVAKKLDIPVKLSNLENGKVMVIGYTILEEDGKNKAILFCNDKDNKRKVLVCDNQKYIKKMKKVEWVGKEVEFVGDYLI